MIRTPFVDTALIDAPSLTWFHLDKQDIIQKVEQRVTGQLLQTLLYEGVIPFTIEQGSPEESSQNKQSNARSLFVVTGKDAQNEAVEYRCHGYKSTSFDLVRLDYQSLERVDQQGNKTPGSFYQAIDELLYDTPKSDHYARFINELEQTFIKDVQSRCQDYQPTQPAVELSPEALEQHFMDAHSYHPCYKSRIGFSLTDNAKFGPEFGEQISLVWLAISKSCSTFGLSEKLSANHFLKDELGEENWLKYQQELKEKGKNPDDFWLIPVHPWQWEHTILSSFAQELIAEEIIPLSSTSIEYQAQQSLRTLQNMTDVSRPYVKLSLSMTNTSSSRILAKHTVLNGPIITDWLQTLIRTNETAKSLDFVILGEIAGVSFVQDHLPESRKPQTYGALGTIWRESIHSYLTEGETAVPFNGLSHLDNQYSELPDTPFIDPWIQQYGLEAWTKRLLDITVPPIIHMLYAEGVGMESHGQNIVLITKNGWPQRIALKDFHDGVRYSPTHLARPELAPTLAEVPESHKKLNRNSFIVTDDVDAVRDFSCDCFFFICLSDLSIFLKQNYQLSESLFWEHVSQVVLGYQEQHPQHASRYKLFDLFAPYYEVEELTKRRLLGDAERRFKKVPNPLHRFGPTAC
ncbi:MAG: IucA/IucC family protein [Marinomonas sp.]